MEIIKDFDSKSDALELAKKLRKRGIGTHVAMYKGNNTHQYGGGPKVWGVWATLDNQVNDARALCISFRHNALSALSEEELVKAEKHLSLKSKTRVFVEIGLLSVVLISLLILSVTSILGETR